MDFVRGTAKACGLVFCVGMMIGIGARAFIHGEVRIEEYAHISLVLSAFCLGILLGQMKVKGLKGKIKELEHRLHGAQGTNSKEESPTHQVLEDAQTAPNLHRDEHTEDGFFPMTEEMARLDRVFTKKRMVRLTKVSGKATGKPTIPVVGFEYSPPKEGRDYVIFTQEGTTFRTSSVIRVAPGYIQTQDGFYELRVIEEKRPVHRHTVSESGHAAQNEPPASAAGSS